MPAANNKGHGLIKGINRYQNDRVPARTVQARRVRRWTGSHANGNASSDTLRGEGEGERGWTALDGMNAIAKNGMQPHSLQVGPTTSAWSREQ